MKIIPFFLAALLFSSDWFVPPLLAAEKEKPPNIVLLISDDQAWTDYGFMGHPVIKTPALDKLASQSAVFSRGYVPTSLCRPSLASMVTGLYPHQHGVTGNDPRAKQQGREAWNAANATLIENGVASNPTIPRELAKLGYVSHQSGKWWEGNYSTGGFSHGMTHGDPTRGGRHGDQGLKIGREGLQPVTEFIDQAVADGKPFFVWYAPFLPHSPHNPPKRLLEKYQTENLDPALAKYYAMCEWFDETCGELLNHLDEKELTENTIVLYVCDNGWIQRTADSKLPTGWNHPFAPRSKRAPQDGGIRTPIMVRWPGHVKPGERKQLASSIDLMPTILRAVGLKTSEAMQGIDLVELTPGKIGPRDAIYGEVFEHDIPDAQNPAAGLLFRWVVDGHWKLILPVGELAKSNYPWNPQDIKPQLFRIKSDPHETKNLAETQPEQVQRLTEKLNQWWNPEEEVITSAKDANRDNRPNFLLLVSDDQRNDQFGLLQPMLKTPAMDRLANRGAWFQNAFVTTSICAASRASIFSGCVERTHGYTFGTPPLAEKYTEASYPALLRAADYRTGFVGKFGVNVTPGATGKMFDVFQPLSPHPYFKKQADGSERHLTDITADKAIEFIEQSARGKQPFCLSVSFNAPHAEDSDKRQYIWPKAFDNYYSDLTIPPPSLGDPKFFASQPKFLQESMNRDRWYWRFDTHEKYQAMVKGYWRMISGVDAAIARMENALKDSGAAENTIVMLIGDNGYFLGERGFAGKWLPYDPSLRVPLMIDNPRLPKQQRHSTPQKIVLNIDIAPTILDFASVTIPPQMQGRSLAPLVQGEGQADWRTDFFNEHLMRNARIHKHEGIRELNLRYSRYFEQKPVYEELFDLTKDPQETKNLVEDPAYRETLQRLRNRTDELRTAYEKHK